MLSSLYEYKILLASESPRREQLIRKLGFDCEVIRPDHTDESYPDGLEHEEVVMYLANLKSDAVKQSLGTKQVLLTADTIVSFNGKELGKPSDFEEAVNLIAELSGNTHQVHTGVCLRAVNWRRTFAVTTEVTFSSLLREEIEYYIKNYEPYDKAGAYGIQEWIGYIAVEEIRGSYFNVMGLPIHRVYNVLKQQLLQEK